MHEQQVERYSAIQSGLAQVSLGLVLIGLVGEPVSSSRKLPSSPARISVGQQMRPSSANRSSLGSSSRQNRIPTSARNRARAITSGSAGVGLYSGRHVRR